MAVSAGAIAQKFINAKNAAPGLKRQRALRNFAEENDVVSFKTANSEDRMNEENGLVKPIHIRSDDMIQSELIAIPGAENGEHYILPNFKNYNNGYNDSRGVGRAFDSNFEYGTTPAFSQIRNIVPGRGTISANGELTITQRGSIDFGNEKPMVRHDSIEQSTVDKGPATPEQQLSEELVAKNAEQLEQGGQKVVKPSDVEVPKEQPQPTPEQPVPKEVVTPVPKETAAPTPEQKVQNAEFQEQPTPEKPIPEKTTSEEVTTPSQPTPEQPVPEKTVTPVNPPVSSGNEAAAANVSKEEATAASREQHVVNQRSDINKNETSVGKKQREQYAAAREQQKALETGSGKSLQESAAAGSAEPAAAGPVDMTIDRAILQQQIGGDATIWGYKGAQKHALDRVEKKLESDRDKIVQNKNLTPQQRSAEWNKSKKEADDILKEGPDFRDYFFGNNMHAGAIGMAAIAGTMGVAFGGHKSNADLYSSPF